MKSRMTRTQVRALGPTPVKYGSPAYNYLSRRYASLGYTCGTFGWNSDIYGAAGRFFETGYRPAVPGPSPLTEESEIREALGED